MQKFALALLTFVCTAFAQIDPRCYGIWAKYSIQLFDNVQTGDIASEGLIKFNGKAYVNCGRGNVWSSSTRDSTIIFDDQNTMINGRIYRYNEDSIQIKGYAPFPQYNQGTSNSAPPEPQVFGVPVTTILNAPEYAASTVSSLPPLEVGPTRNTNAYTEIGPSAQYWNLRRNYWGNVKLQNGARLRLSCETNVTDEPQSFPLTSIYYFNSFLAGPDSVLEIQDDVETVVILVENEITIDKGFSIRTTNGGNTCTDTVKPSIWFLSRGTIFFQPQPTTSTPTICASFTALGNIYIGQRSNIVGQIASFGSVRVAGFSSVCPNYGAGPGSFPGGCTNANINTHAPCRTEGTLASGFSRDSTCCQTGDDAGITSEICCQSTDIASCCSVNETCCFSMDNITESACCDADSEFCCTTSGGEALNPLTPDAVCCGNDEYCCQQPNDLSLLCCDLNATCCGGTQDLACCDVGESCCGSDFNSSTTILTNNFECYDNTTSQCCQTGTVPATVWTCLDTETCGTVQFQCITTEEEE